MFPATDLRLLYILLLKLKGVRIICEINEYPLASKENGVSTNLKRYIIFKIFKFYSGFIVISENLKILIDKYKSSNCIIYKLPVISIKPEIIEYTGNKLFRLNYIFHAGSLLEGKDNISDMLIAFGLARRKMKLSIKFILTGVLDNSSDPILIKKIIAEFNMEDDVIFTGFLSHSELSDYMSNAKLAMVLKKDNLQNNYCFATKLSEYFSYKIPVITTLIGENKNYIIDNYNAFVVNSNIPELVSDLIIFALENELVSSRIGLEGYNTFLNNFELSSHKASLNDWIDRNFFVSLK
jgi:glycosyltransferase involved in cell wall biosynthesis